MFLSGRYTKVMLCLGNGALVVILSALFKMTRSQRATACGSGQCWLERGGKSNHSSIWSWFVHCTLESAAVLEPYHEWSLSGSIALSSEGQRRGDERSQRVVVLLRGPQGIGDRAPAPTGT